MAEKKHLVIAFKEGIYGFEDLKEFSFYKTDDEENPVTIMQSIKRPEISFLVIPPTFLMLDYEIELDKIDVLNLEIENKKDVVVLVMLNISSNNSYFSANFKSPIVFSLESRLGKQIILENSEYETKHIIEFSQIEE